MIRLRTIALTLVVAAMLAAPLLGTERYAGMAIRCLSAALFAMAFNLLWQQTRLLSFGHGVYFGAGMFAVVHLMRATEQGWPVPLALVPLAGAMAGFAVGLVCGALATLRSGTYFAMITLAIAELIHSLGTRWEALFGGEAGLSSMRTPSLGVSFGNLNQVYGLTVIWFVLAIAALWFFSKSPLGRIAFALGDNEQRLRFLGFSTHTIKIVIFAFSAALSGLAGGLLAIADENVHYSVFGPAVSALPVLYTFIGGANFLLGPAIGAVLLTAAGALLSDATRIWLLYQGLIFIVVVIFVPGGLGSLRELLTGWTPIVALRKAGGVTLLALCLIFLAEAASVLMSDVYASRRSAAQDAWVDFRVFWLAWSPVSPGTWLLPLLVLGLGIAALRRREHPAGGSP